MAINNFGRLNTIYRAGTNTGPEVETMTQIWVDPNGTHHLKTKLDGAGLSTSFNENTINFKQAYNRAVVVGKDIFWLQASQIYTWNTSTGALASSHVLPTGSNGALRGLNTGLYHCIISGVPHIATVHCPNDTTVRAAVYNVTTSGWENRSTWTPSAFDVREPSGGFRAEIFYNNKIYACGNKSYFIYNPQTDIYTEGRWPLTSTGPYDWCPFNGKLYATGKKFNDGSIQIYEMNGGPQLVAETPGFGIAKQESLEGRCCLFTDREYLYSIYYSSGTPQTGFGIYKFGIVSGVLNYIADVTTTISLGTAASKNGSDVNNTSRFRCNVFVNQLEDPDGQEGIVFYFDRGGGTGNHLLLGVPQYYEQEVWDTSSSNLQYDDANTGNPLGSGFTTVGRIDESEDGGPADNNTAYQMAYTNAKNGAGERVYNISIAPEPRIQITNIATSGLIVRINYKIATNTITFPDGTDAAVLFKYDASQHSPRTNCYLQNSNAGTIIGDRKIVVSANSNVDYYVEWNAEQDGFVDSVRATLVSFIAATGTT